jgi:serine/threonine protein kinase
MNDPQPCPHCGKPLSPDALQGLCPDCLLKAGMPSQTDAGASGPGGTRVVSPPPPPAESIAPFFPHLEILGCLGRGGMGAVYKARQPKLDRCVALKILALEKAADPKFAERFSREAQALARLNHPNIVAVYDFGEAGGYYYLLMEYVDGLNLRQVLESRSLKPEEAVTIVPRICEALQFAHDHGVVHRDIKPENILLDKQGRVKIADFGIAKILGQTTAETHLTAEQQIIGTPHYMAPEQVERPRLVDHRADIYSLGVVFYELLTGELPLGKFALPSQKVRVDVRLDQVVLHALEKEPERRYQQASQVKTDVETIASSPAPSALPPRIDPVTPPPADPGPSTSQPADLPGTRVTAPALGLIVAGSLKLLSVVKALALFALPGTAWLGSLFDQLGLHFPHHWIGWAASGLTLAKALPAPFIVFGGIQMLRLRSYAWAVAAAILAIVSVGLVSLGMGIWALVILTRPGVREAFAKPLRAV